jgi:Ethanolamine utilization protein EutJ (predicted chaperonin)
MKMATIKKGLFASAVTEHSTVESTEESAITIADPVDLPTTNINNIVVSKSKKSAKQTSHVDVVHKTISVKLSFEEYKIVRKYQLELEADGKNASSLASLTKNLLLKSAFRSKSNV